MSFLCIPFLYPSEINSSRMRSIGNSVAMITNWLFVYVVVIMTPSGKSPLSTFLLISDGGVPVLTQPASAAIANIAWRFYIIFAVLNFVWFPIIWFFYVETKGLSLEEVDLMFKIKYNAGKAMTYKEAAKLAKEEADTVRKSESQTKKEVYIEMEEDIAGRKS
jgi:hypothetical protein